MSVNVWEGTLTRTGVGGPAVGQQVSSPWFEGSWPITQGWGPSSYAGEPEGHGYSHWHAGADVGLACGTHVLMPAGLQGYARWVDNPGGYGTALRVELDLPIGPPAAGQTARTFDVWLGHLRQRLVSDGQRLRGGETLAISNNTGNSTGCHLHFEVRPAKGRYGTDVDPAHLLLTAAATPAPSPGTSIDPLAGLESTLSAGIKQGQDTLLGVGQAALGSGLLLGGLTIVAFGLRGQSGAQLGQTARSTFAGARRSAAAGEYAQEKQTQGAIAADLKDQAGEAAATRRNTIGAYRAGLISRRVAQERLGERIAPTGPRPKRTAIGRGISGPGVYRKGRGTVDVREPAVRIRRSRVRLSHQKDFDQLASRRPAAAPLPTEPPF